MIVAPKLYHFFCTTVVNRHFISSMRSNRKQPKGRLLALLLEGERWPLNAKGKHVTHLVKTQRRDLKALMRKILQQKALPVDHPTPVDDCEQSTVNQEEFWGGLFLDELPVNVEKNGLWDDGDFVVGTDWNPDLTSNFDKDLYLGSFGDK
jgi:hypothetical protein